MIDEKEFRNILSIDKFNLDSEIESYADILYRVSVDSVTANAERDRCRDIMKQVEGRLQIDTRVDREQNGEKATDKIVESLVAHDIVMLNAIGAYRKASIRASTANARLDALKQKSYMLRGMIDLHASNYFAEVQGTNLSQPSEEVLIQKRRERISKNKDSLRSAKPSASSPLIGRENA